MNGRRLVTFAALALVGLGCEGHQLPTATGVPIDPSQIISDGAHGGNPDFFFLPPMVPLPSRNPDFELGKFNNTLKPSLKIEICELKSENLTAKGFPSATTGCVAGAPLKTFAPGSVQLVNLPLRQNGWWSLFGLPADGFYYVLWDTRQSNLNVNKYYRIKVLLDGSATPLGIADVDPMSNLFQWKYTATGDVVQLIDNVLLPIPFRVEHGGGPALCGAGALCNSVTVTNNSPSGSQLVTVDGGGGAIAGAKFPNGWLPADGPQSVVVTISQVNTGEVDPVSGAETTPCHVGLPLLQFPGCFRFTTTPALAPINEGGDQFATPVTVAVCYTLQDSGDPREKFAEMWASGPNEPPHALDDASDVGILAVNARNCSSNVIGFNDSKGVTGLASAGWRSFKGGLNRLFGVKTAYAVDLGLGGITKKFSNIGPALTAQIEAYTNTELTLAPGATTTSTARIVGSNHHDSHALPTGIGGLPVTFTVAAGNGTLLALGSEGAPADTVTVITNTNLIDASPVSGGGFAPVNWTVPSTPGTYTLTATGPALGGSITYTATVPTVVGFNGWRELTLGGAHTCGIASNEAAYCWGNNSNGLLGDGTATNRATPTAVGGGLSFVTLSAGSGHTCGWSSGRVYCWGFNGSGELGDGTTTNRVTPVPVSGEFTFASLALGQAQRHTCALTDAGAAYCWGANDHGALGDGTSNVNRSTPVAVVGDIAFVSLTVGGWHTCGLTSSGAAYCWGFNRSGQLGDNSTIERLTPVPVAGEIAFATLTAGYEHTCGLTAIGATYCWGQNTFGELGDGSTTDRLTPGPAADGFVFSSLTAGLYHTCGVTNGAAYCWGYNPDGQLGDGTTINRTRPAAVGGEIAFRTLSPGQTHTCGVASTGIAYCWGVNSSGQLGDGSTTNATTPVAVINP